MSKLKKIVIFLVVLGALIIINLPKEDDRVKMEKEFTINDFTFAATILYENKELVNFRPSPENRYECSIEYIIKTLDFSNITKQVILSNDKPIEIKDVFFVKDYEDSNIIMYSSYMLYKEDGIETGNNGLIDGQSIVHLKRENSFIAFNDLYGYLIKKLNEAGYKEYNEEKMSDISKENYDQWIEN